MLIYYHKTLYYLILFESLDMTILPPTYPLQQFFFVNLFFDFIENLILNYCHPTKIKNS